jgi:hypothetical protein
VAWCGLTNEEARYGITELKRRRVIEDTGEKSGRAIVWRLASTAVRSGNVEAGTPAVEGLERALSVDPAIPLDDQRFVDGAEAGASDDVGVGAGRDTAAALWDLGHVRDDNRLIGTQTALNVDRGPAPDEPDAAWLAEIHRRFGGDA